MTDPIADYLTRLRNAISAKHRVVEVPASNLKKEITKIEYEYWHYRYVGVPHAYYIMKNNLCLEEYLAGR